MFMSSLLHQNLAVIDPLVFHYFYRYLRTCSTYCSFLLYLCLHITRSLSTDDYHFFYSICVIIYALHTVLSTLDSWIRARWLLSLPSRPLNSTFATHLPTDLFPARQISEEATRTQLSSSRVSRRTRRNLRLLSGICTTQRVLRKHHSCSAQRAP